MSTVISAMSLAIGLSTPVAGWFVDRIGARVVIAIGTAIAGAGMLIGSQANSFFALTAAYALFGAGCGGASLVSASYVVANWFGGKRGIAMGVMMMGTSIGAALAAPLVSHVVGIAGWRWGLTMLGSGLLVIALPLAALFLRMPVDHHAPVPGSRPAGGDRGHSGVEVGAALRLPSFWFYCLILFLAFAAGSRGKSSPDAVSGDRRLQRGHRGLGAQHLFHRRNRGQANPRRGGGSCGHTGGSVPRAADDGAELRAVHPRRRPSNHVHAGGDLWVWNRRTGGADAAVGGRGVRVAALWHLDGSGGAGRHRVGGSRTDCDRRACSTATAPICRRLRSSASC